ncbi:hypothetical protein WISP_111635 [Willisornis vidua]|uniref:Uncharacterized protein n=1 Tax=Willisornis vidua TaxID=1566151 RepID=A0ABQ9CVF7_9PASS|nr:hypothetical protein WISP_111635 [Willisornis vidua]
MKIKSKCKVKGDSSTPLSALERLSLAYCVQLWDSQYEKDMNLLEWVLEEDHEDDQRNGAYPLYVHEDKLREMGLLSTENTS